MGLFNCLILSGSGPEHKSVCCKVINITVEHNTIKLSRKSHAPSISLSLSEDHTVAQIYRTMVFFHRF